MNKEAIINKFTSLTLEYGPKIIVAIFIWIIGSWLVKQLTKGFVKVMETRDTDDSLKPFLRSLVSILLKVLLVLSILGTVEIEITSFIAILGAAGLAIGMALSGTLQNFAGGVIILLFKPFKVGDFIDAKGHTGTVKEIQIFNTILKTPENITVIIPNGELSNASLKNFSLETQRRVDWKFGVGYGDNADHAEMVIKQLCDADDRILTEPEPFIALSELGDNSINFVVRAWVEADDYWPVFFDMNKKIYEAFNKEGLNIPFPQMDVHLFQNASKN
ncbi:mechanosensitive ion channel family protein [Lacihabitans sp. LS3-19]|uniref:mechanosensitive ion channel family protein n=1 Tax=Lacihabitans sp. LS3-19 TaxID=2487335 RepID=UPI0020CC41F7|nr:mechanosensitive ion channel domain-containing protein [Lacihabitans sp. LS3-19]MCP9768339.1 mechanosensitive ion channel family protein [Lacihabitans sp. LS3-19]